MGQRPRSSLRTCAAVQMEKKKSRCVEMKRRISECVFKASRSLKELESDLENMSRVSFEHKEKMDLDSANLVPSQAYRGGEMSFAC